MNAPALRPEDIVAMRAWIAECAWQEDNETLAALTDAQIIRGIARHYAGGVEAFLVDGIAR
jgi:hypothetical protein